MNTIGVTLDLPEDLVEKAREAGVLTNEKVAELIEAEIERQSSMRRFQQTVQQLRRIESPISQEEIDAEIETYKADRAAKRKQQN
jgi:hypothetical protein